jgi:hypothetical protein
MKHKKEIAHYDDLLKRAADIQHDKSREALTKSIESQRNHVAQGIGKKRGLKLKRNS